MRVEQGCGCGSLAAAATSAPTLQRRRLGQPPGGRPASGVASASMLPGTGFGAASGPPPVTKPAVLGSVCFCVCSTAGATAAATPGDCRLRRTTLNFECNGSPPPAPPPPPPPPPPLPPLRVTWSASYDDGHRNSGILGGHAEPFAPPQSVRVSQQPPSPNNPTGPAPAAAAPALVRVFVNCAGDIARRSAVDGLSTPPGVRWGWAKPPPPPLPPLPQLPDPPPLPSTDAYSDVGAVPRLCRCGCCCCCCRCCCGCFGCCCGCFGCGLVGAAAGPLCFDKLHAADDSSTRLFWPSAVSAAASAHSSGGCPPARPPPRRPCTEALPLVRWPVDPQTAVWYSGL
eukprot:359828-Chlamydomonas_euryale.AAC.1